MNCSRKITEDLYWVGANDRRLALFENVYPLTNGVSYNAYLLMDEKTVLFDTVDHSVSRQFLENLKGTLAGRALDYLIISHMEPDHCSVIGELFMHYPAMKIICNAKTQTMIGQFFDIDTEGRVLLVKEGDTFDSGNHEFTFAMAPMVHWPEVMVEYDKTTGTLFSADAFGTFGALSGNLFADEIDFADGCMDEARRYYTNIVGKYGPQVQAMLKKTAGFDVSRICPLHGPVWRKDVNVFLEKYQLWSSYTPEEKSVLIVYGSVYGNTEQAAELLAGKLADKGVRHLKLYDVSKTDASYILADAFRYSHIVLACATYNNGIFTTMETLLHEIKAHNLQNRTFAVIDNGTWAPAAGKQITELLASLKNNSLLEEKVSLKSALKPEQEQAIDAMADALMDSLSKSE